MDSEAIKALSNFQNKSLYWRTVNAHPYQSESGLSPNYNFANLAAFFKEESNYSFQWLFLNNANSDAFDTVLKSMPIGLIMRHMINLARPVYTDFTETNKDKDFLKVSADFYRELFWLEKIYVTYDFFKDNNNFIYEGKQEPIEIKHLKRKGGFDIWLKLTGNDLDDDLGFMHVKTGITVKIPEWYDKMAIAEWCGDKVENFINWFEYATEYLASLKKLDKFSRLMIKRVKVEATESNPTQALEDLEGKIGTIESTLTVSSKTMDLINVEYANGADLESLHYTTFNTLDRRAYELGRVSNTNPKGERLTSGENYKDISSIANRQKATLERLESFAEQCKELWNIELSFSVSGIPEKQRLDMVDAPAPDPNTDSTDTGAGGLGGGSGGFGAR